MYPGLWSTFVIATTFPVAGAGCGRVPHESWCAGSPEGHATREVTGVRRDPTGWERMARAATQLSSGGRPATGREQSELTEEMPAGALLTVLAARSGP